MLPRHKLFPGTHSRFFLILLVVAIISGVLFRFLELDRKVYWHDEVYTSFRAAGFTREEIDQELFQNQVVTAPELQKYQRIKPESTAVDTIHALAVEDQIHPPFYYLIARGWMQIFGSSITASRSLPALLSLFSLPLMYSLALELFESHEIALLATTLIAISPFSILFAQTARQYSLFTVFIILSSYLLIKAIRSNRAIFWVLYSFASVFGLYTHLLFSLTLTSQAAYIFLLSSSPTNSRYRPSKILLKFLISFAIIILAYSPWIGVVLTDYQHVKGTIYWMTQSISLRDLLSMWRFDFTALFFDVNLESDHPWKGWIESATLGLILLSIYELCQKTDRSVRLFILTSIFIPFLILALPDLLFGGIRSTVPYYLSSCFPAVQLAVAYLLASQMNSGRFSIIDGQLLWRGILVLVLTASLVSCGVSLLAETWWNKHKYVSYYNAEIAHQINATQSPLMISDPGDDYTNTGNLISLSYLLNDDVKVLLFTQQPNLSRIPKNPSVFVFRPSQTLHEALEEKTGRLELVFPAGKLWQLKQK